MNGNEIQDVVSILKHNVMLNISSLGLIVDSGNLLDCLYNLKLHVTGLTDGAKFDYIFIPTHKVSIRRLLRALTDLKSGGIIIVQLEDKFEDFEPIYKNTSNLFFATKVKYDNRYYLIIHSGEDYGN